MISRHSSVSTKPNSHVEDVSRKLRIVFHKDGIVSQFDGFEQLHPFDLVRFRRDHHDGRVDWVLEKGGGDAPRYQVAKQADFLAPALPEGLGPVRMGFDCAFGAFELRWTGERLVLASEPGSQPAVVRFGGACCNLSPGGELGFAIEAERQDGAGQRLTLRG